MQDASDNPIEEFIKWEMKPGVSRLANLGLAALNLLAVAVFSFFILLLSAWPVLEHDDGQSLGLISLAVILVMIVLAVPTLLGVFRFFQAMRWAIIGKRTKTVL